MTRVSSDLITWFVKDNEMGDTFKFTCPTHDWHKALAAYCRRQGVGGPRYTDAELIADFNGEIWPENDIRDLGWLGKECH